MLGPGGAVREVDSGGWRRNSCLVVLILNFWVSRIIRSRLLGVSREWLET
jgi:hypothetical protein